MARESFAVERMRFRPRAEDAAPERSSGNSGCDSSTKMPHLRCWTWIIPFRKTGLKCGRTAKFRPTGFTRPARRWRPWKSYTTGLPGRVSDASLPRRDDSPSRPKRRRRGMARESFAVERMRFRPRAEDAAPERSSGIQVATVLQRWRTYGAGPGSSRFAKQGSSAGARPSFAPPGLRGRRDVRDPGEVTPQVCPDARAGKQNNTQDEPLRGWRPYQRVGLSRAGQVGTTRRVVRSAGGARYL